MILMAAFGLTLLLSILFGDSTLVALLIKDFVLHFPYTSGGIKYIFSFCNKNM